MDQVRFGIIGLGNIGTFHASYLNDVSGAALTAIGFAFSGFVQPDIASPEMNVPWLAPLFLMSLREGLFKPRISWTIL